MRIVVPFGKSALNNIGIGVALPMVVLKPPYAVRRLYVRRVTCAGRPLSVDAQVTATRRALQVFRSPFITQPFVLFDCVSSIRKPSIAPRQ
jgi:hypothetical protein